jgi:hypothetical protein
MSDILSITNKYMKINKLIVSSKLYIWTIRIIVYLKLNALLESTHLFLFRSS